MTDQTDHRPEPDRRCQGPEVWACVLVSADGIDTWICRTEDLAFRELAGACRRFWADALDFDRRFRQCEEQTPMPTEPPSEDRAAVEVYFAVMERALPPESFVIASRAVIGDGEGGASDER